jgi:hypothetical protein
MSAKATIPKITKPGLAITLRRLAIGVPTKKDKGEWECQPKPQSPRVPFHWWKAIPKKEWPKQQQSSPLEDEEVEVVEVPEEDDKDAVIQELPKASKDTRSRPDRHQVRTTQVKRNRIRKVKPTALRIENMMVARGMLERSVRSGKIREPSVGHMSNMIVKLR